MPRMTTVRKSR